MGLPCVVLYRLSRLSAFIGRRLVHVDNFSLPNILLGEGFQPELLHQLPDMIAEIPGGREYQDVIFLKDAGCRMDPPVSDPRA